MPDALDNGNQKLNERQRRLLSIMLSISSFVIYNGKGLQLDRDLGYLGLPDDLCTLSDRETSLLWLQRDIDMEQSQESVADFVYNLFDTGSKSG